MTYCGVDQFILDTVCSQRTWYNTGSVLATVKPCKQRES